MSMMPWVPIASATLDASSSSDAPVAASRRFRRSSLDISTLSYISIDRDILWLPGWQQRDRAEQRQRILERIAAERWVMDGTGPSTFDLRVPRSDVVIWVRMPRLLCIWGVLSRWLRYFGRTRPEMAPGCIEKVDWEFIEFIWAFEQKFSPRIVAGLAEHGPDVPVLQLKSRRQVQGLLDLLGLPA